jgi:hypothetical protein
LHFEVFHHLTCARLPARGSMSSQATTGNLPLDPLFRSLPPRREHPQWSGGLRLVLGDSHVGLPSWLKRSCKQPHPSTNPDLSGFADPFSDVGHEVRHAWRPDDRTANSRAYRTRHLPLSAFLTPSGVCSFESSAVLFHPATAHRISITGSGWHTVHLTHKELQWGLHFTQLMSQPRNDRHASATSGQLSEERSPSSGLTHPVSDEAQTSS